MYAYMMALSINCLRSIIGSAFDSYTERSSRLVKRLFRFNRKVAGSSPAEGFYFFSFLFFLYKPLLHA